MSALPTFYRGRDERIALMSSALRCEVRDAFARGGYTRLTNADGKHWTLIDAIADELGGIDTETKWRDVVDVIQGAAQGTDVRAKARGLIDWLAERHAYWHASDIVDGE